MAKSDYAAAQSTRIIKIKTCLAFSVAHSLTFMHYYDDCQHFSRVLLLDSHNRFQNGETDKQNDL
jgi:hypothetical protein